MSGFRVCVPAFLVFTQSECLSMSNLLGTPSGHSLGSQPQDLRQQLAVFVPAKSHPMGRRGRDAGGEHRLVEGLLEGDGLWRGWGELRGVSGRKWGYEVRFLLHFFLAYLYYRQSPLWHNAFLGIWELELSWNEDQRQNDSLKQTNHIRRSVVWGYLERQVPFRPCSIVALLGGSTQCLCLATASCTLSFHRRRFPSNTDNHCSGTNHYI